MEQHLTAQGKGSLAKQLLAFSPHSFISKMASLPSISTRGENRQPISCAPWKDLTPKQIKPETAELNV